MKIEKSNVGDNNQKYSCKICGHQVSQNKSLVTHMRIVHEEVKYPCGQCHYQATTKSSLAKHKRAVHEGVKLPCTQCSYEVTFVERKVLLIELLCWVYIWVGVWGGEVFFAEGGCEYSMTAYDS